MESIELFYEYNGQGIFYQNVSDEVIYQYQNILPDFLINIWRDKGLSHFNDGFFWIVNPNDYKEIISLYKIDSSKLHVVLRTAFGGFIYFNEDGNNNPEKKYNYICPIYNQVSYFTNRLSAVMNGWLTSEDIYAPLMFSNLYEQARKKLPIPAPDECYGFVPAIALGGDFDADNIKIVKMKEHLSMLSQLK